MTKFKEGDLVAEEVDDWYLILLTKVNGDKSEGIVIDGTEEWNNAEGIDVTEMLRVGSNREMYPSYVPEDEDDFVELSRCILIERGD